MARKFSAYLICLLFAHYCSANPVLFSMCEESTEEEAPIPTLRGSHILEFEESSQDRAIRLAPQLIAQVQQAHVKQVLQLLWLGASVSFKDELDNTALHYAAMGSTHVHCKMAIYLLAHGADPASKNKEGHTPVSAAAHFPAMLNIFMQTARSDR